MNKIFSIFTALAFLVTLSMSCDKTNVDRFELNPDEVEVDTIVCDLDIEISGMIGPVNPVIVEATVLNGTPPYTYLWSDSSTVNPIEVFQPDVYSVTVTDANGCTIESSLFVDTPESCDDFSTEIVAEVDTMGGTTLTAVVMGGMAPYAYIWSDSSTVEVINVSAPGTYSVTATDANGCEADDEIML